MNHLRHPIARTFALTGLLITLSACSSLNDLSQLMGSVTPVAKPAAKEIVLINGKDLNAWKPVGNANWRLQDGLVQAELGDGFLITRDSFKDFHLVAEFWVDDEANSGVFYRCTDAVNINDKTAYEANIYDKRPDPSYGTGAIVGIAKSQIQPNLKTGGRWSTYDITVKGSHMTLVLNGQTTVDTHDTTHMDAGPIALQYNKGVVKFRKLTVQPL